MSLKVPYAAASAERGSALQMDKLGGAGRERVPVPVCLRSTCPWSRVEKSWNPGADYRSPEPARSQAV